MNDSYTSIHNISFIIGVLLHDHKMTQKCNISFILRLYINIPLRELYISALFLLCSTLRQHLFFRPKLYFIYTNPENCNMSFKQEEIIV